jgi:hypothetical protein
MATQLSLATPRLIDQVIAVVGGEYPITLYEVEKLSSEQKIPPATALKLLLQKRLLQYQLRSRGISIDSFTLQEAFDRFARERRMSPTQLRKILQREHRYQQFLQQLREKLEEGLLFKEIARGKITVTPEEAKSYYKSHLNQFRVWKKAQVVDYSSFNPEELKLALSSPFSNPAGVSVQQRTLTSLTTPLPIVMVIHQPPPGQVTPPIIGTDGKYHSYQIVSKEGTQILPFEKVAGIITKNLYLQKQEGIIRAYFDKLANDPNLVQFLKGPQNHKLLPN